MNETERLRLLSELSRDRRLLLAAARSVTDGDLGSPTRNPGWTVAHVLGHVLASDKALIDLLQAADQLEPASQESTQSHESEMDRWLGAGASDILSELEVRSRRWQDLLSKVTVSDLETMIETSSGPKTVANRISEWHGHDAQHGEDVQLAV